MQAKIRSSVVYSAMVFTLLFGFGFLLTWVVPTSDIDEDGVCVAIGFFGSEFNKKAAGFMAIFIESWIPLLSMTFFYTHIYIVLGRKVAKQHTY